MWTGVERWALSVERWALSVGRWALSVGRWALSVGRWALSVGSWTLGRGCHWLPTAVAYILLRNLGWCRGSLVLTRALQLPSGIEL
jgi:hypothetical protein